MALQQLTRSQLYGIDTDMSKLLPPKLRRHACTDSLMWLAHDPGAHPLSVAPHTAPRLGRAGPAPNNRPRQEGTLGSTALSRSTVGRAACRNETLCHPRAPRALARRGSRIIVAGAECTHMKLEYIIIQQYR